MSKVADLSVIGKQFFQNFQADRTALDDPVIAHIPEEDAFLSGIGIRHLVTDDHGFTEDRMLIVQTLIDNLPMLIEAAMEIILALALGISDALPELIPALVETMVAIVNGLLENLPMLIEAALTLMIALGEGLIKAIPTLIKNIPTIITNIVKALKDGISKIKDVGAQLLTGLWNGISSKVDWIYNQIKSFAGGVVSKIKSIFGIHSPSKVMAGIGENLALGLGEGWDNKLKTIGGNITASMSAIANPYPMLAQTAGSSVTTNNYYRAADRPLKITVQSVLDGRVIGETAYSYDDNNRL